MSHENDDPRFPSQAGTGIETPGDSIRYGMAFDKASEEYSRNFAAAMRDQQRLELLRLEADARTRAEQSYRGR